MNGRASEPGATADDSSPREIRGRLLFLQKYVALFVAVVSAALVANGPVRNLVRTTRSRRSCSSVSSASKPRRWR